MILENKTPKRRGLGGFDLTSVQTVENSLKIKQIKISKIKQIKPNKSRFASQIYFLYPRIT